MNLFEISQEYMTVLQMAEDPEVDLQAMADTMEAIEADFEDKADAYAHIITQLKADAAGIEKEMERLTARRDALKASEARLKTSLTEAMRATGKTKFKTTLHSFGIQKNGGKVPLVISRSDYENLPECFQKVEYKPDTTAIREYLETGKTLSWAALGERGESIRIR